VSRDVEVYTRRGEWVSVSVAGSEIRVVAGDGSGDGMAFLTGRQYGWWTAVSYASDGKWNCTCHCGKSQVVDGDSLKLGRSTKCRDCRTLQQRRIKLAAQKPRSLRPLDTEMVDDFLTTNEER
jgi:hypothetical protein